MKIALICSNSASGGLIRYIESFLKTETQHDIVLYCGRNLNIADSEYIRIIRNDFSIERGRDLLFNKKLNKNLINMVNDFNPDIVIFMNGYIRRGLEKYKKISILHNQLTINKYLLFKQRSLKLIASLLIARKAVMYSFKKADGIIFLSDSSKKETDKYRYKYKNGVVINFGHDVKILHHISNNKKNQMIYISTFYPYKNHMKLIDSLAELKKYTHEFHLNLIGFNPSKSLVNRIDNLGLSEYITFYGWLPHDKIIEMILHADIYIHPSLIESTSNGVLEGVVVGNTIACSDIDVFKDTLRDKAIYFNPNDVSSITESLIKAIEFPNVLSVNDCQEIFADYNYKNVINKVYKYAEKIVNKE